MTRLRRLWQRTRALPRWWLRWFRTHVPGRVWVTLLIAVGLLDERDRDDRQALPRRVRGKPPRMRAPPRVYRGEHRLHRHLECDYLHNGCIDAWSRP